jgi:RNA polymerase sigma-70 factor (sigma-E family)
VSSGASFDNFAREHLHGLVRFAALLSGSATLGEDLVQEVLARIFVRWDELDARTSSMLAYVRRAIVNEHVSWRRRWSTRHIYLASDGVLPDIATPAPADAHDEQLWRAVLSLPSQQRAAVVLRFYEDLDDDEIAAVLSCRRSTVRANISRGVAKLRAMTDDQRGGSNA